MTYVNTCYAYEIVYSVVYEIVSEMLILIGINNVDIILPYSCSL